MVVSEALSGKHSPIEPALPISLVGLGLSYDLFGGQRDGLGKLILREVIGQRKQQPSVFRLAHGNSSIVARICRIKSRTRRRSAWDPWE